jgi:signal transduction histidine kinase
VYLGSACLLILSAVPLTLRYTGSVAIAGNLLAGEFFLALTTANVMSVGSARGTMLTLVLVPALGFLAPGRAGLWIWSTLVCIEVLMIPHLGSLGLPQLLQPDALLREEAMVRIPILLVLFILAGGLVTHRISQDGLRRREKQQRQLEALNAEKEMLEQAMLERQRNLAAVGTLAASVAHQINNPVGSILAAAQYSLMTRKDCDHAEIADEAFATIEIEARRCGQIVRSLLRIAGGENSEKWEEDIHGVVRNAYYATRPYAIEREVELRLELADGNPRLLLSPIELEQAIVNLIRNGIEACDPGAKVIVRTFGYPELVRIEVRDTGQGLSKDCCERVFEPFYTTRRDDGGSGLGLSLVKEIVEDHWGTVSAYPDPDGKGTIFAIELPLGGEPSEIHIP